MDNFPPNSRKAAADREPKNIKRVTSADAVRRKKSLGKQFSSTFIGGDAKSALHYVIFNVLIPAAKDALAEAGASGIEKLIFGESRARRGNPSPVPGRVNYNGMSREAPASPRMSKRARSQHDFDEIVLVERNEAEDVIDRLYDLVSRYDAATVADLYELTGLDSNHIDHKWGWTSLRGAGVTRTRSGGYLLDLPDPEPLQ